MTPKCTATSYCRCGATGCPMTSNTSKNETSYSIEEFEDNTIKPLNRHERRKAARKARRKTK